MATVASNLSAILDSISRLTRKPEDIAIVGVTKLQPVALIREALAAGVKILANNYAKEGSALRMACGDLPAKWHFIGHIQSRKVKSLTDYDCIQSLDRISVAKELEKRLQGDIEVLVEINIGGEAQKSGIASAALPDFLCELHAFPRLRVRGLMAMPPPLEPVEARRPFFQELRRLFDRHSFDCLSMGTSRDYLVAIQEGSTMVRLGTALFGERK